MRKKRKIIFSLLLILTIPTLFLSNELLSNKELKTIVSSFTNAITYKTGNTITILDKPTGLIWKEGSTATATWNKVNNANYYLINVYVYHKDFLVSSIETGTSNNELDIQQEISKITSNYNYETIQVTYDVKAQYLYKDTIIESETSLMSTSKKFDKGNLKLQAPTSITLSNDYKGTWTTIEKTYQYTIYYKIEYNGLEQTGYSYFLLDSDLEKNNGTITADLTNALKNAYTYAGYSGQTVNISYKVVAEPYFTSGYIESEPSEYSNSISYTYEGKTKLQTPTNITLSNDYKGTWTSIENAFEYTIYYKIEYNDLEQTGYSYFFWSSDLENDNGTITADLTNALKNAYTDAGYTGQTVKILYKVVAKPNYTTNYIESEPSEYSNSISYTYEGKTKLQTPTNITLTDDYKGTWTSIENAQYYRLYYKIEYDETEQTGYSRFFHASELKANDGIITVDLTNTLQTSYSNSGYSNQTVKIAYAVIAEPYYTTDYLESDMSQYSNFIYYNPEGSTIINKITLSPSIPVIAVGRSIYIGKTINPESALYSKINWTSSDTNTVFINNMGQIKGLKPGKAIITAQINNATQTAEVNVYEIKSNIKNEIDSAKVIDKANEIIESIIIKGDATDTDITDITNVLEDIQKSAQNGDLFNVDIKYEQLSSDAIIQLKEEIKNKYKGYNIAGANNINIEMSHEDIEGEKHRIGNITEFENEIEFTIDLSKSIPKIPTNKMREYKLIRKHNRVLENIEFSIDNGIVKTNSDKFSEFVLLYKDVDIPATGISVNTNKVDLNVGDGITIEVNVLPENAANKNFTSVSLDETIATVERDGIRGVAPGTTKIKFTSEDGKFETFVDVTVSQPLLDIELNKNEGTMRVGEKETLQVIFHPSNTTDNKNVTWTSSDTSVVTVENGVVEAVDTGMTTVTVRAGNKSAHFNVTVIYEYAEGDGTKNNPYIIKTPLDLYYIKEDLDAYYELGNDIDLTYDTRNKDGLFYNNSKGWKPISETESFTGIFDGKNHKIKGIYQRIVSKDCYYCKTSLFGSVNGTIRNLIIEDYNLYYENISNTHASSPYIAVLASGVSNSTIENIIASGEIEISHGETYTENLWVAGMIGIISDSVLNNITNKVNLNLGSKDIGSSGGIATNIEDSTLKNITNYGRVEGYSVGGISTYLMDSNATNLKNYGSIKAVNAGGISFQFSGSKMSYSSNYGALDIKTDGNGGISGGLVGWLSESVTENGSKEAIIEKSFNVGSINVILTKKDGDIGGLVGSTYGNQDDGTKPVVIRDSYNIGELNVTNATVYSCIGGLVGRFSSHIENSYNAGNIKLYDSVDAVHVNEIVGAITRMTSDNSAGSIDKTYYVDKGINGYANDGGAILLKVKALSFNEAINKTSYTGFDFDNIWTINNNYPFPQLKSNPQEGEFINSINVTNEETNILSKQEYQLTYSVSPSKFTKENLIFEIIEGKDLATIDQNGKINLTGKGKIKVKVSSKKINAIYDVKEFNLLIPKDLNELNISNIDDIIYSGQEQKPEIEIYDGDYKLTYDDYKLTYKDNIEPGIATITIKGKNNYKGEIEKTFNIVSPLKNITFDKTSGIKNVGEIDNLTVVYNPSNTTDDKTIKWESSNELIATVDSTGKVIAIAPGKATITATVGDKTATYVVDVKQPLTSISLNKATGSLIAEREELLTVTYNPSNTTDDKTIIWTTSDPSIAKVADGYVKAISAGTVTIIATVGEKIATYELTVMPRIKLTSISLNKKTGQLNVGENEDLVVTYNPIDTNDDKTVLWTTSNAAIATVNNGKVTAIAPGQATITATVGDKTTSYTIDVKQPLTSISLNKTSGTLRVEGTEILTITYNPSNTTEDKTVTWTSDDTSIATVENGKVIAIAPGKATITAKVGYKTAKYDLTVVEEETLQEKFIEKGFKIKNSFVHGFKLEELLTNIKNKVELNYTSTGGNKVIATGVEFKYNKEKFTAVVYGDLNGDGKINSADLLKMRQHLLGTSTLTGAYKEAGSIATGTTINSADLLRIRQHLLGQKLIEQ